MSSLEIGGTPEADSLTPAQRFATALERDALAWVCGVFTVERSALVALAAETSSRDGDVSGLAITPDESKDIVPRLHKYGVRIIGNIALEVCGHIKSQEGSGAQFGPEVAMEFRRTFIALLPNRVFPDED